jgi:hypothetical protein
MEKYNPFPGRGILADVGGKKKVREKRENM